MANAAFRTFVFLAFLAILTGPLCAQDGGVKVTTTIHADGSRTELVRDLSTGTGQSKTYDEAGRLVQSMTLKLNEKGDAIEGTLFNAKGVPTFKYVYVRDDSGLLTEEQDLDAKGNLLRRLVYHYSTTGTVSGIDTYDAEGNLLKPATGSKKPKKRK